MALEEEWEDLGGIPTLREDTTKEFTIAKDQHVFYSITKYEDNNKTPTITPTKTPTSAPITTPTTSPKSTPIVTKAITPTTRPTNTPTTNPKTNNSQNGNNGKSDGTVVKGTMPDAGENSEILAYVILGVSILSLGLFIKINK